jgi:predicted nucleic acid-binding protein
VTLKDKRAIRGVTPCSEVAFVLDATALLAYLRGDEGGAVVQRVLRQCQDCETRAAIAAPALLDTYAVAAKEAPALFDDLVPLVEQLPLDSEAVTSDTAREVADLVSKEAGLTSDQATGLALSQKHGATLVTADQALADRVSVLYVGPRAGDPEHQR